MATLNNCVVTSNTSRNSDGKYNSGGGGLFTCGTASLNNCTLSFDTASSYFGGGVYVAGGTANLTNCTFSNDTAVNYGGGGLYNACATTLTACTFSNDSAGRNFGGGLWSGASFVNNYAILVSCTFTNNTAGSGGGLYNNGTPLSLTNTIVAGNSASAGPDIDNNTTLMNGLTSGGNNLIGNTSSTNITWQSSDLVNISNPGLAPLGSYGGPTQTIALESASPAKGAGPLVSGASTDQRGFPRPQGQRSDIGAFQTAPLAVNTASDSMRFCRRACSTCARP